MIFAARCGFSGSTLAATSIDAYPSARVSKIGVTWRMIRSSIRCWTRRITSSSVTSASRAPRAQGRCAADARVRAGREREAPLHEVEQLLVEVVERDRRAVLAGAKFRLRYRSH